MRAAPFGSPIAADTSAPGHNRGLFCAQGLPQLILFCGHQVPTAHRANCDTTGDANCAIFKLSVGALNEVLHTARAPCALRDLI